MQLKLTRKKDRIWLLTIIYRINKLASFLDRKSKIRFFLNMEWIFSRLALEEASHVFLPGEHPRWKFTYNFLSRIIDKNSTVLDFGCKYGDLSSLVASIAKKVIAVDYDTKALDIARKNYPAGNIDFISSDAFAYLETYNGRVDLILLSHIIEHLDEPELLLTRAAKFTRYIYIEVPDFDSDYMNHFRLQTGNKLIYSDNDHITEFDRDGIHLLLTKANLKIKREEYRYGVIKVLCECN